MSAPMTRDEIVNALVRQGVDPAKAEQVAARRPAPPRVSTTGADSASTHIVQIVGPPLLFPIRLTLPWSALCSDNEREKAGITMRDGKPVPRKVMTARYRAAREKIIPLARAAMTVGGHQFPPLDRPLAILARVYAPTQRRVDVANFAKGVHDALSKIVYTDDQWLHDVHWVLAGADMDQPRVELEVRPL